MHSFGEPYSVLVSVKHSVISLHEDITQKKDAFPTVACEFQRRYYS